MDIAFLAEASDQVRAFVFKNERPIIDKDDELGNLYGNDPLALHLFVNFCSWGRWKEFSFPYRSSFILLLPKNPYDVNGWKKVKKAVFSNSGFLHM